MGLGVGGGTNSADPADMPTLDTAYESRSGRGYKQCRSCRYADTRDNRCGIGNGGDPKLPAGLALYPLGFPASVKSRESQGEIYFSGILVREFVLFFRENQGIIFHLW